MNKKNFRQSLDKLWLNLPYFRQIRLTFVPINPFKPFLFLGIWRQILICPFYHKTTLKWIIIHLFICLFIQIFVYVSLSWGRIHKANRQFPFRFVFSDSEFVSLMKLESLPQFADIWLAYKSREGVIIDDDISGSLG